LAAAIAAMAPPEVAPYTTTSKRSAECAQAIPKRNTRRFCIEHYCAPGWEGAGLRSRQSFNAVAALRRRELRVPEHFVLNFGPELLEKIYWHGEDDLCRSVR